MSKIVPLLTASILIAGCAKTTPIVLGPDHPASVDAPAAPIPPPAATPSLVAGPTTAPSQPPDAAAPSHEGRHAGHTGHGGAAGARQSSAAPAATAPSAGATYACPHHPEVVSD